MPDCEHDWQWGEGRNAGSAECRKCRTWQVASSITFDLRTERDSLRAALVLAQDLGHHECSCLGRALRSQGLCDTHEAIRVALGGPVSPRSPQ